MAYNTRNYTNGIGSFTTGQVMAEFTIPRGGLIMRVSVVQVATISGTEHVKLQHSSDGTNWSDVRTTNDDGSGTVGEIVIGPNTTGLWDGILPLKSHGRLVAVTAGTLVTTTCTIGQEN